VVYERRYDLIAAVDLVLFDTTSVPCEGDVGQSLGRHRQSKDHRQGLRLEGRRAFRGR
jgi:hypothetical protein